MHHLVFAIYLHSPVFLLMTVVMIPDVLGFSRASNVASIGLLWVPAYLFIGMRRFYADSRLKTFVKFVMLSFTYWVLGVLTLLLVLVSSLLTA